MKRTNVQYNNLLITWVSHELLGNFVQKSLIEIGRVLMKTHSLWCVSALVILQKGGGLNC